MTDLKIAPENSTDTDVLYDATLQEIQQIAAERKNIIHEYIEELEQKKIDTIEDNLESMSTTPKV